MPYKNKTLSRNQAVTVQILNNLHIILTFTLRKKFFVDKKKNFCFILLFNCHKRALNKTLRWVHYEKFSY